MRNLTRHSPVHRCATASILLSFIIQTVVCKLETCVKFYTVVGKFITLNRNCLTNILMIWLLSRMKFHTITLIYQSFFNRFLSINYWQATRRSPPEYVDSIFPSCQEDGDALFCRERISHSVTLEDCRGPFECWRCVHIPTTIYSKYVAKTSLMIIG